jgi:hypothetical protein
MLPASVYFVVEIMIYSDIEPSGLINFVHLKKEILAMAFINSAGLWIGDKKVGMDHFMKERFLELVAGPIFEKRF